jgi:hypothetical protein
MGLAHDRLTLALTAVIRHQITSWISASTTENGSNVRQVRPPS